MPGWTPVNEFKAILGYQYCSTLISRHDLMFQARLDAESAQKMMT